jgi:hypothetical protein
VPATASRRVDAASMPPLPDHRIEAVAEDGVDELERGDVGALQM